MGGKRAWFFAVCVLAPVCALGQTPSFRGSVRRVLVPVCVTGRHGAVVAGLKRQDFEILVDGRRVPTLSMDWISATATGVRNRVRRSPPGKFSNAPHPAPASWVVLLVDYQNTQPDDMMWMRTGVLRFLRRGLRPGQPMAIYGLSQGLLLLQPFTYQRQRLVAAADRWIRPNLQWNLAVTLPRAPKLPGAEKRPAGMKPAGGPASPVRSLGTDFTRVPSAWSKYQTGARQSGDFSTDGALRHLAILLAPLPGRKVVIWAGDGQPLLWRPLAAPGVHSLSSPEPDGALRSRAATYQLLNEANVELFPLDPRGLLAGIPHVSGPAVAPSNRPVVTDAGQMLNWADMRVAAQATGGKALVGNNFLWQLLGQAQQEWSNYYLLSFQPPPDAPGKVRYHQIRVRVDLRGVTVRGRRGYITQAPQVLLAEHPRPGFDMAAASPANLSGVPLIVRWGSWRRRDKWRTRRYRLGISVGGAGCRKQTPCRLKAGVVISNARGWIIGQRGYLVKLRAGSNPAARIWLKGRVRVNSQGPYIARFMVRSRPSGRFGALILPLDPPAR
ncbi:MAG: VWA domain-containing protein [Terriglobales bacterium]